MTSNDCAIVGVCVIAAILGLSCCLLIWRVTNYLWQLDAIANGVAEYYLDENNERKFRWKK